jgi:hypothetical protein
LAQGKISLFQPTKFNMRSVVISFGRRPYQKPKNIMKMKGIKEGEFKKIKDIITVK